MLPWQGIKKKTEAEHIEEIMTRKITTNPDKLCSSLPKQFKEYILYCRDIKFYSTPDYKYLKN